MGAWQSNEKKKENGGEKKGIVTWLRRKMFSIISSCKRGVEWVTSSLVSVFDTVREHVRSMASACKKGFEWVANLVISACGNVINWLCSTLFACKTNIQHSLMLLCFEVLTWIGQLFIFGAMKFLVWVFDSNGTSVQPLMPLYAFRLILKLFKFWPWGAQNNTEKIKREMGACQCKKANGVENGIMVCIVSSCKKGVEWVTSFLVSVFNTVREHMCYMASACKKLMN